MGDRQIHFEVFAQRNQHGGLALEMATEDRAKATEHAAWLMEGGARAVRVNKEVLDPDTGQYSSATIFSKGVVAPQKRRPPTIEEAGPPCFDPADLYTTHARQRIERLLEAWLSRQKATPFELLHRPDLAEKLEAAGGDLQHAVQKVSIPEAQARGASLHEVIRNFNGLIDRAIVRVVKDGRRNYFADFRGETFAAACTRLAGESDAGYRLGGGVAAHLAGAKTWADKIERLLDLADQAPPEGRPRALAFDVLEQPLGEILGSKAGVADLVGPGLDLGGTLAALTRLAASQSVEMLEKFDPAMGRVMPPLTGSAKRLARWMAGAQFQEVRLAIGKRVIEEIRSSRRLRPSDANAEIDVLRALAMALTAAAGKMLSAEDIREAFIERSRMLIGSEFVNAAIAGSASATEEVRALLRLAENVTGPTNKGQAAQWLISAMSAAKFEREIRNASDPPMNRMALLADLQRAIGRVDLPEAHRQTLSKRLGELGGMVETDAGLVNALVRSPMPPVQRLGHLLKMAMGETCPLGPAAAKAKDAALKLGKSPDIRADLAKAPDIVEKLMTLAW